ncbi:oxepin-CoA hydrolase, alternative type [Heliomarina baculiformis]|uniref:oxepin-CoA hydrolase, alternative type n=1 Tax=Heliomarina baculiformis TaxID=2872036 RepID=UPI001EE1A278|nr:enoyl-CoA hydratase family protein [Heliomarina baculiformis]
MNTQTAPATELRVERDGPVLVLSLDAPNSRNSISPPVYKAIQNEIITAGHDSAVRAIVLTGLHGFFSSGGNINNLKESAKSTMAQVSGNTDGLNSMILAIRNCPTPVIAAVEGGAAGAGLSLALACDMIVAAEGAKFVVAYVKVGLAPDGGVTHFLSEGLPRQIVSEMCLTGNPVESERLYALGLVNAVVPAGEVLESAKKMASKLAAGAVGAMGIIKSEIAAAPHNDLATQLVLEAQGINTARFGAEAAEGLAAFIEKREPDFVGKE